jgi:hypothetical protein
LCKKQRPPGKKGMVDFHLDPETGAVTKLGHVARWDDDPMRHRPTPLSETEAEANWFEEKML